MKNKEKKERIKNLIEKINEQIEEENLLEKFSDECFEVENASCDMSVSIIANVKENTLELMDLYIETSYSDSFYFKNINYKEFVVYGFKHKTWETNPLWDECIDVWRLENNKENDEDYNIKEVEEMFKNAFKDTFPYDFYYNHYLEEQLESYFCS